jgi:hypothetical protein
VRRASRSRPHLRRSSSAAGARGTAGPDPGEPAPWPDARHDLESRTGSAGCKGQPTGRGTRPRIVGSSEQRPGGSLPLKGIRTGSVFEFQSVTADGCRVTPLGYPLGVTVCNRQEFSRA